MFKCGICGKTSPTYMLCPLDLIPLVEVMEEPSSQKEINDHSKDCDCEECEYDSNIAF